MLHRLILIAIMGLAAAGCNNQANTRAAPSMAPTQAPAQAPQRNLLQEVGDTTVRIVQEPVRLMTPRKEEPKKPEVYEPPAMIINRRGWTEPDPTAAPATQPANP